MNGSNVQSTALDLLMVTPRFYPLMGGVETHVYEVARRLARRNVRVTVLTTDPGGKLPAAEVVEGVCIRRVQAWPADRDYYFAPALAAAIAGGKWDLVHLQSYHTLVAPLAMLSAALRRTPYVVTFHPGGHSSAARNCLRGVQQRLLRPLLANAARLIAVARFELDHFRRQLHLPAERFAYIPNGCDVPEPIADSSTASYCSGRLILSVGRLEHYKGHHRLVAALPHVLAQEPDARLWIAGAGSQATALREQADALGVGRQVEIRAVPPADRQAMAQALSRADLVALLSEYETHPIAALEAIALGRSVLVADGSGLRELAQQGLARAVPLDSSAEQVAAAVVDQLRHPFHPPPVYLPTWDDCTVGLLDLYRSVLA